MTRIVFSVFIAMAVVGCAHTHHSKSGHTNAHKSMDQVMQNMTPEQMMAKMKEAGTPGEEHAYLEPLVGEWKTHSKFWMDPSKAPEVDTGSASHKWMYGKKFIKEEYKGQWNGQPFQGMGLVGYDKTKKGYISTWMDSMGTGIMTSEGEFNPKTKTLEMTSSYYCPMTGGPRTSRAVTRIISRNKHVLEMYDTLPDGKEFKMMEITYTRKG